MLHRCGRDGRFTLLHRCGQEREVTLLDVVAVAESGTGTTSPGLGHFQPHFFSTRFHAFLLNCVRFTADLLSSTFKFF